jgi:hypothetical protein
VADLEHRIGKPIEALDKGIELKLVSKRLAKLREQQGLRNRVLRGVSEYVPRHAETVPVAGYLPERQTAGQLAGRTREERPAGC